MSRGNTVGWSCSEITTLPVSSRRTPGLGVGEREARVRGHAAGLGCERELAVVHARPQVAVGGVAGARGSRIERRGHSFRERPALRTGGRAPGRPGRPIVEVAAVLPALVRSAAVRTAVTRLICAH